MAGRKECKIRLLLSTFFPLTALKHSLKHTSFISNDNCDAVKPSSGGGMKKKEH